MLTKNNILLGVMCLSLATLAGGFAFKYKADRAAQVKKLELAAQKDAEEQNQRIKNETIIGVLREFKIDEEESKRLGIKEHKYILTAISPESLSKYPNNVVDPTIISNKTKEDLKVYLGKCVKAYGNFDTEWKKEEGKESEWNLFKIKDISETNFSACPTAFKNEQPEATNNDLQPKVYTATGVISRFVRPYPDIWYDYIFEFIPPRKDITYSEEYPSEQNTFMIIPANTQVWELFEKNIGKHVTITGSEHWGYAESKYLKVTEVK